jgi:hypothetical protein
MAELVKDDQRDYPEQGQKPAHGPSLAGRPLLLAG